MSPRPTFPPPEADQDASVLPHTEPRERADTNPTPTASPDPASGNRAPVPPLEETSHTVPSDQLVGVSLVHEWRYAGERFAIRSDGEVVRWVGIGWARVLSAVPVGIVPIALDGAVKEILRLLNEK